MSTSSKPRLSTTTPPPTTPPPPPKEPIRQPDPRKG